MPRVAPAVVSLLASALAAGCGSSHAATPRTPAATAHAYLEAIASDHGAAACALLTTHARLAAAGTASCPAAVHRFVQLVGRDVADLPKTTIHPERLGAQTATLRVTLHSRTANMRLERVAGAWRIDTPRVASTLLGV